MITIEVSGSDAFNYKTYFADYHKGAGSGNPVFSEGSSGFDGDRISLIYEEGEPQGKVILLDGENFEYTLSNHYLSGRLQEITYTDGGKAEVTISGLDIYTPKGENDPLGPLVYSLMGDDPSGGGSADANPKLLMQTLASEAQHFIGGGGDDVYVGTKFNDIIEGGLGKDKLNGGAGKDSFVFDTKAKPANVDAINKFVVKDDTIELDHSIFKGVSTGTLAKSAFVIGDGAEDAKDRVIYDERTGSLYYDADGSGPGKAVEFATIGKHLDLTFKDFHII